MCVGMPGYRSWWLPLMAMGAVGSAEAKRRYAIVVRGDAYRNYGERHSQARKNALRCTPVAAEIQRAVAKCFRRNVIEPLQTVGEVEVFLSGAGCSGDTASSVSDVEDAEARRAWDEDLSRMYAPVVAASIGGHGKDQTEKVIQGLRMVRARETEVGSAFDAARASESVPKSRPVARASSRDDSETRG